MKGLFGEKSDYGQMAFLFDTVGQVHYLRVVGLTIYSYEHQVQSSLGDLMGCFLTVGVNRTKQALVSKLGAESCYLAFSAGYYGCSEQR